MTKLEQILGARSMSRIIESFEIVEVKGADRRRALNRVIDHGV
jgi:hypothetical protein